MLSQMEDNSEEELGGGDPPPRWTFWGIIAGSHLALARSFPLNETTVFPRGGHGWWRMMMVDRCRGGGADDDGADRSRFDVSGPRPNYFGDGGKEGGGREEIGFCLSKILRCQAHFFPTQPQEVPLVCVACVRCWYFPLSRRCIAKSPARKVHSYVRNPTTTKECLLFWADGGGGALSCWFLGGDLRPTESANFPAAARPVACMAGSLPGVSCAVRTPAAEGGGILLSFGRSSYPAPPRGDN